MPTNNAWAIGGTEVTSWDVCTGCGRADWEGHTGDCSVVTTISELQSSLEIVEKEILALGEKP